MNETDQRIAAYNRRERVAEIVYDWIHESQVTHRRRWKDRSDEDKAQYRKVATDICAVFQEQEAKQS